MDFVQALFFAGRHDEAFAALDRAREQFPNTRRRAHVIVAYDHLVQGRWAEAIAAFEKGTDPARPTHWLGLAYGLGGRTAEARATLAVLHQRATTEYVSPQDFAIVHLGLGERDEVFRLLAHAYEQRSLD